MLTEAQVGAAFRELREINRYSLDDVKRRANLRSKSIVWRLENGSRIDLRTQAAIAEAMNMPLSRVYRHAERNVPAHGTVVPKEETKAL